MNNLIRPLTDLAGRVVDFVVEYECEACKRRRAKLRKALRTINRKARDACRKPRGSA